MHFVEPQGEEVPVPINDFDEFRQKAVAHHYGEHKFAGSR